jgi:hypothetical protein
MKKPLSPTPEADALPVDSAPLLSPIQAEISELRHPHDPVLPPGQF